MQLGLIDDIVIFIVLFLVVSLRNTDGTVILGANSVQTFLLNTTSKRQTKEHSPLDPRHSTKISWSVRTF